MLSTMLAVAAAKFLDPILFLAAFASTYRIRRRRSVFALGVVLGILYEFLLNGFGFAVPTFHLPLSLIPAVIAGTAHAWLAYGMYWLLRNKAHMPATQPWRGLAIGAFCVAGAASVILPGAILATIRDGY